MNWRRFALMVCIVAVAAVTQLRVMVFGYGMMLGALALMCLDKWTAKVAEKRQAEYMAAIMREMKLTFAAQCEVIEATRVERDHYRRLYLKKVNGE